MTHDKKLNMYDIPQYHPKQEINTTFKCVQSKNIPIFKIFIISLTKYHDFFYTICFNTNVPRFI